MKEKELFKINYSPDILFREMVPLIKWIKYQAGRPTASPDLTELIYQYYFEN